MDLVDLISLGLNKIHAQTVLKTLDILYPEHYNTANHSQKKKKKKKKKKKIKKRVIKKETPPTPIKTLSESSSDSLDLSSLKYDPKIKVNLHKINFNELD
jgi:hypothetical protein